MKTDDKTISDAVDGIVEFVTRYSYEEITPLAIFNESGYREVRELVTEKDIESRLKETSFLVTDWINFSEDQRHTPSWFLTEEKGNWKTGFVDKNGKINNEKEFKDKYEACSHFIKMFMELMVESNG